MKRNIFSERTDPSRIETGTSLSPRFDEQGLIPCITTDHESGEVLMFAWMNREALIQTLESGKATYYSRSRKSLWIKGESSGRGQKVREVLVDCDQDVIQLRVVMEKPGACHRGYRSCFYRKISESDPSKLEFVEEKPQFDPDEVYRGE